MRQEMRQEQGLWARLVSELRALLLDLYAKDVEPLEVGITIVQLIWCAILLAPGDTFGTSLSYRAMAALGPEWAWGAGSGCLAALPVAAYLRRSYTLRATGLLLSAGWFAFVLAMLVAANPATTGWVYALGVVGSGWSFRRLLDRHGWEIPVVRRLRLRDWRGRGG